MLDTTLRVLRSALEADQTETPKSRNELMQLVRDWREKKATPIEEKPPVILPYWQVADRFGKKVRFVYTLLHEGVLKRYVLPGRQRACGCLESEVNELVAKMNARRPLTEEEKKPLFKKKPAPAEPVAAAETKKPAKRKGDNK